MNRNTKNVNSADKTFFLVEIILEDFKLERRLLESALAGNGYWEKVLI